MNQIETKVNEDDKKMCDEEIEEEEIDKAIDQLCNGKSPGLDGLPSEFYKVFRNVLMPILHDLFITIYKQKKLKVLKAILGVDVRIFSNKSELDPPSSASHLLPLPSVLPEIIVNVHSSS